jgi:hypothetical protein
MSGNCSKCSTRWSSGQAVAVIEHNLDVIKTADWILDLGPEGGVKGGEIVAEGTPEDVAKAPRSYTPSMPGAMLRRGPSGNSFRSTASMRAGIRDTSTCTAPSCDPHRGALTFPGGTANIVPSPRTEPP